MALKSITSPGVQINERDLSTRPATRGGTVVFVPGFAAQGPVDEVFALGSMQEFERVYGKATNAAERYFHQSARAAFSSTASVISTRLPYGSGAGFGVSNDKYTALFFPVLPYGEDAMADTSDFGGGSETVNIAVTGGHSSIPGSNGLSLSSSNVKSYLFGKPQLKVLTRLQYEALQHGNYDWNDRAAFTSTFDAADSTTWGGAGMIVLNKLKTNINDKYEGSYMAIADNTEINPSTDFTSVMNAYTVNEASNDLTLTIPSTRLNFKLSGTDVSNDDSVSETLENIPGFDIAGDEFDDTVMLGVFKLRTSVFANDALKLDSVLIEPMVGSFDSTRRLNSPAGGNPRSFFLGDLDDASPNITLLINKHISYSTGTWAGNDMNPTRKVRFLTRQLLQNSDVPAASGGITSSFLTALLNQVRTVAAATGHEKTAIGTLNESTEVGEAVDALIPLGHYEKSDPFLKTTGNIPQKLDRIFRTMDNVDAVPCDITCEAGLGTIYATTQWMKANGPVNQRDEIFDDEVNVSIGTIDHQSGVATDFFQTHDAATLGATMTSFRDNYRAVFNKFNDFAEHNRKDHIHIADGLRQIYVDGKNDVALFDKRRTFTQCVYWPMRHLLSHANTSYTTVFGNWAKCFSTDKDGPMWCPFSGYAAATMANNDTAFGPWYAPAGFRRGRFGGVLDLAVSPSQKHRDQLYKINVNPVASFPGEGFVIFGQKTMYKKPSAFDRLNVRRLFLYLEKIVRTSMKYYVFEPNTMLTRAQILNNLTPIFEQVRVQQGLYDYLIICDQRNNTPTTIDSNELIVDIYLKPVRAAEIILVNFYATRSGQSFNEITG